MQKDNYQVILLRTILSKDETVYVKVIVQVDKKTGDVSIVKTTSFTSKKVNKTTQSKKKYKEELSIIEYFNEKDKVEGHRKKKNKIADSLLKVKEIKKTSKRKKSKEEFHRVYEDDCC